MTDAPTLTRRITYEITVPGLPDILIQVGDNGADLLSRDTGIHLPRAAIWAVIEALSEIAGTPRPAAPPEPQKPETPRAAPGQVRAAILDLVHPGGFCQPIPLAKTLGFPVQAVRDALNALSGGMVFRRIARSQWRRNPADVITIPEIDPRSPLPEGGDAGEAPTGAGAAVAEDDPLTAACKVGRSDARSGRKNVMPDPAWSRREKDAYWIGHNDEKFAMRAAMAAAEQGDAAQ